MRQLEELWLRDNRVCHLCLEEVDLSDASRDHIVPRSVERDNSWSNLRLAHKACNSFRMSHAVDAFPPEVYRAHRAKQLDKASRRALRKSQPEMRPSQMVVGRYEKDAWYCKFCGVQNVSPWMSDEWLDYRRCMYCQARNYKPFGFVLY